MKILHIDTSSKNCSVAISDGLQLLCSCEETSENYRQSESLHTFITWALEGAHLELRDIDAVSLGRGPGSYTGLRIGAAAAKGFCYALDIPLVGINSLETMIEPFLGQQYDYIIPLLDARRMEVYTAVFHGKTGEMLSETEALVLEEDSFSNYSNSKVLFAGDGVTKAQEILRLPHAQYKPDVYSSAKYLIKKAHQKISLQDWEDVAYFEPFYLKEFQGVKKKNSSE